MRDFLKTVGRVYAYALTAIFYHTFFIAYMCPYKAVLVKIDVYGEAFLELIILIVLAPIIVYSMFDKKKCGVV